MDLSLLPHLSDEALRREARARGVSADDLDREGLIGAIRSAAAVATTVPPRAAVDPVAPTEPPGAALPLATEPLRAARALLGRVVTIARTALDRRPNEPSSRPPPAREPEPIRTRTLAKLLADQGHVGRARDMLRDLAKEHPSDTELVAELRGLSSQIAAREIERLARERLGEGARAFVEIVSVDDTRAVLWRVDAPGLARARALLPSDAASGDGELVLQVVHVVARPEVGVQSRRDTNGPVEASGWMLLDAEPGARVVASVGLRVGEQFVSVAHASG